MVDPDITDILLFKNLANKSNVDLSKPSPASGVLETPKVTSKHKGPGKKNVKVDPPENVASPSDKKESAGLATNNSQREEKKKPTNIASPPLVPTKLVPTKPSSPALPKKKQQQPLRM